MHSQTGTGDMRRDVLAAIRCGTSRAAAIALLGGMLATGPLSAQAGYPVAGIVRDTAGTPVSGAEVLTGDRRAETDPNGRFRIDGLASGTHVLTIRAIGFHPGRKSVDVPVAGSDAVEIWLLPAPVLLPIIVVNARRTGIYGVVGDTAYHPALGAKVELLGADGGVRLTDSLGRFAFPEARRGTYLLRVTLPGYVERRRVIDLGRNEGRELTVLLAPAPPGYQPVSGAAAAALWELDRRLAFTSKRDRLTRDDLDRFGSLPLCDLPVIRRLEGTEPVLVVDGVEVYFGQAVCNWRTDEIDLLEWGVDLCREPSGSLRAFAIDGCARLRTTLGGRVGSRGYVVVWRRG